jgi:hypothetical protein
MSESAQQDKCRRWSWARLAQLGFWFFLIKGLLWLIVPAAALWLGLQVD